MDQAKAEKITLGLSLLAYKGISDTAPVVILKHIQEGLDILELSIGEHEIVWGPAFHITGFEIFTDALMFVVQNKMHPSEYTVVVRGTSPLSLSTLVFQDLWVNKQVFWDSGNAPLDAKISTGVYLGLHVIQQMRPSSKVPGDRNQILEFLSEITNKHEEKVTINVTGHSLGGTLAATFALWLHDKAPFIWPKKKPNIHLFSYAGLTAGNRVFARYSNEVMGDKCFRYYNPLDVAPHMFSKRSMQKVPDIYKPHNRMGVVRIFFNWIYRNVKYKNYTQTGISKIIHSEINKSKWFFTTQLDYQHTDAYANRLAELINEGKSGKEIIDGKSLIHALDLEGVTERFSKQHIKLILKKVLKKLKHFIQYIFEAPIFRIRIKLRKHKK